jgi:hypothetical protein
MKIPVRLTSPSQAVVQNRVMKAVFIQVLNLSLSTTVFAYAPISFT